MEAEMIVAGFALLFAMVAFFVSLSKDAVELKEIVKVEKAPPDAPFDWDDELGCWVLKGDLMVTGAVAWGFGTRQEKEEDDVEKNSNV